MLTQGGNGARPLFVMAYVCIIVIRPQCPVLLMYCGLDIYGVLATDIAGLPKDIRLWGNLRGSSGG
ncbi:hypothetical protein SJI19_22275 [Acerihabitans sp. TG2]|uniref:hypothetical protein n=1 Tax=Acerihabitans sp. TG2 TaxID=3096008 RepID=UPI002B23E3C9|nr:hypothetical protein [Acerihabitans sp. TG2]MEA9393232.1 hypothetical protein [Acerihabitans sp. TG2]